MSPSKPSKRRRARLWVAMLAIATAVAIPALALAHGSYEARAKRPVFDAGSLRLVGGGGYATQRKHASIRVTVCLSKRYGGRFFDVRCQTNSDSDRRVKAQVSVPGCVKGVWRTSAVGQAQNRSGALVHTASDVSATFRCS